MKVRDLNGKVVKWKLNSLSNADGRAKSDGHEKARDLLRNKYPTLQILEEVAVPVMERKTLFFDFYVPLRKIAVEVHGEQHYKFVAHFHTNLLGFLQQVTNDEHKREWCELNGISLIELPFDKEETWEQLI